MTASQLGEILDVALIVVTTISTVAVVVQVLLSVNPNPLAAAQTRAARPESADRRRFRRLLQPCSHFSVAELERTRRIPLEPSVNSRGRVNWMRRTMISLIWPTFAKPAFLLSTWHKVDGSTMPHSHDRFTVGGYRLLLRVADSENRAHLRAPIAASVVGASRTLLICTPENFLSRRGPVHCCAINGFRVKLSNERPDTVIVYSVDKQRHGMPTYRKVPRCEVPPGGIWLLSLDRQGDIRPEASALQQRFSPTKGYKPISARMARMRCNLLRSGSGPLPRRDPCLRNHLPPFMLFTVVCLAPLLLLMLYAPSLTDAVPPIISYMIILAVFLLYQIWVWYVAFVFSSLVVRGLDAPPSWTATTLRCLADGTHIRDGLYRHLCRQQRAEIHPRSTR